MNPSQKSPLTDYYCWKKNKLPNKNHTTMNKQKIQFDMELFQGYTCIGCAVINDLEVDYTIDIPVDFLPE